MRRERLIDVAIPLVVFVLTLLLMGLPEATDSGRDGRSLDALGIVLAAATALPLLAVRRRPLLAFMLSTTASAAIFALDYPPGPPIGPTVALFYVALTPASTRLKRWLTPVIVVAFFSAHIAAFGLAHDTFPDGEILLGTIFWGGTWVLGERTRLRRQRIHELEERAQRAERDAERDRQLAAAEERTRIARDLHDSAGHAINVILVQAGAARLLQEQDPEAAREALGTIEAVARETLGEIDRLVGTLREQKTDTSVEPPQSLDALENLVAQHRAAGLEVDVRVRGSRRRVPPSVARAAYRIVQESLTNAARYGTGRADLGLSFGRRELAIFVRNPTSSLAAGNGENGHGIVGMRERAALLGGTLRVGRRGANFRVLARLPYGGDDS
ncbi:MAG TPA: histidine kinase [Gaiellaceae bacterium]|nr:histidine kinase [Gaiellaceae bacterium]